MRRKQRIAVVLYCAVLSLFCIWVPWSITTTNEYETSHKRLGYGWIWAGPRYPAWLRHPKQQTQPKQDGTYSPADFEPVTSPNSASSQKTATPDFSDIDQFVATANQEDIERSRWDTETPFATPDLRVIAFQVLALSLIASAVLFAVRSSSRPISKDQL